MRIYKEEIAGSGKERVLMATGKEEIELMFGILEKARIAFPAGEKWKPDANRLKNIVSELQKALEELFN